MSKHNLMIGRGVLSPGDLATATLTIPRGQLKDLNDITVWVFPFTGQDVTCDWRAAGERAGSKAPLERTGAINHASVTNITCDADQWTPMHLSGGEIALLGDLLIDITAGATAPTDIHVIVMGNTG
jgi:hypothetical protein